jgi:hypothetical protein
MPNRAASVDGRGRDAKVKEAFSSVRKEEQRENKSSIAMRQRGVEKRCVKRNDLHPDNKKRHQRSEM